MVEPTWQRIISGMSSRTMLQEHLPLRRSGGTAINAPPCFTMDIPRRGAVPRAEAMWQQATILSCRIPASLVATARERSIARFCHQLERFAVAAALEKMAELWIASRIVAR